MRVETDRLLLREMKGEDIPALVEIWTDPEVTRYLGGPRDRGDLVQGFEEDLARPSPERYDLWPVVEKASGQVVGDCGLLDKEVDGQAEVELVYVLARAAWGHGYATEMARALVRHARSQMGLRRLISLIEVENEASERVAARVGMHLEKNVVRPGGKTMKVYAIELGQQEQDRPAAGQ